MDTGLYTGVPFTEYGRWPGVSQSALNVLRNGTPAHLRYWMDHPTEATPAMRFGSAVHKAVLEPHEFDRCYVMGPEDARTKAGKAALEATPDGVEAMKPDDYWRCQEVARAVRNHPTASALLTGESEASVLWDDTDTGLRCKGRFDHLSRGTKTVVDLKTTKSANPEEFTRSLLNFGYHVQAAHYLNGAERLGLGVRHFVIIAVETQPPFAVAVYRIKDDSVAAGAAELHRLLTLYAECKRTDTWPSYGTKPVEIGLPLWAIQNAYQEVEG